MIHTSTTATPDRDAPPDEVQHDHHTPYQPAGCTDSAFSPP